MGDSIREHVLRQFCDGDEFDSSLWTRDRTDNGNYICKIRLKVYFHSVEVKTGPGSGYYQEEDDRFGNQGWDRTLWEAWKREYKLVLEDYWTAKFWLITPEKYTKLNEMGQRPNIRCDLMVELVPTSGGTHHKFNIIRVADYRVNRRWTGGTGYTGWLSDVGRGSDTESESKLMILKNVGHLFSMPHMDRQAANHNKYFIWQSPVMGTGGLGYKGHGAGQDHSLTHAVRRREIVHALPWQIAMERHTGVPAEKWKVSLQPVGPTPLKKPGPGGPGGPQSR